MRTKLIISTEVKILVLPPLVTVVALGFISFFVGSLLPSGMVGDMVIFCLAIILIPVASYFYGHRILFRVLGAGIDRTATVAKSFADGTNAIPLLPVNPGVGSVLASVEKLAAQVKDISTGIAGDVEKINSGVEQLSAGANEILFTSQMQTASINDTKQVMNDMGRTDQSSF